MISFHEAATARRRSQRRSLLTSALLLVTALPAATLPGCAMVTTYEKCGVAGCPGDRQLTTEVNALLQQHPALQPPTLISARSLDHVIYLSGVANTDTDRRLAGDVASKAQGVTGVINSIGIDNGAGR